MRFNTFRYLVREGVRSLRQNLFMSAASILVLVSCLLITGCAYLVFENVEHAFDWAYQQNVVVAYAVDTTTDEQATALKTTLDGMDNVAEVEYISKEALLDRYKDEFGEVLEDLAADNPLQDAFVIRFVDLERFDETVAAIRAVEGVEKVDFDQELSQTLVKVRDVVMTVGVWVIALLLAVSLFIIANTIKLTVYSRRLEISIMRSVGATSWFVRFPFMVEGVILGGAAGALGYGLLFAVYEVIRRNFTFTGSLSLIPFTAVWWQLLLGFLVGGMLTGLLGSTFSMGRYLRETAE
ncbi:MAG: permease-like cell division protein FtsX [Clostridia bacterium]|nr:permease-like cell division protein FtsX [Clostridia bacterium]